MSRNEIYDVSAELEKELGAKGTPQREAAINHAWEEYNAQILLDARKNAGLTQAELAKRIGADKGYISRVERGLYHTDSRYIVQDSSGNGNDS